MAGKKHDVLVACREKLERFEELKDARRKKGGLVLNVFSKKGREANKKAAAAKKAWKKCMADHDGATPRFYVHGYSRAMKDIGIEGGPDPDSIPHKVIQTKKSDSRVVKAMKARNLPDARVKAEKSAAHHKIKNAAALGARASAMKEALRSVDNTNRVISGALDITTMVLLSIPEPTGTTKAVAAGFKVASVAQHAKAGAEKVALTAVAGKAEQKYTDEVLRQKASRGKKASDAEIERMNREVAETERLANEALRAGAAAEKETKVDWYEDPTTWIAVGLGLAAFAGVGMFARRKL